jgi:short-subunit dehydrogenase
MTLRALQGRRILVTGASGGIGRAIAESVARRGARVVVSARSADRLDTLVGDLKARGCDALAAPADVTSDEDRKRLIDTILTQLGGLDVLINNAGVASFGHFATSTEGVLRTIMEVNFFAPVELMRLAIPALQKGVQPAIVNVASMCGRRGMPAWPEYSASKFALCGMTEALRGEMSRFDIDVLLILPGLTKSELNRHLLRNEGKMDIPFDKGMPPAEVAEGIVAALEKNRTETVLGGEAKRILWLQKFAPRILDRLIARRVKKLYEKT